MIKLTPQSMRNTKLDGVAKATAYWATRNENEQRIQTWLQSTNYHWEAQFPYQNRVFDFFCTELSVAIEVDGAKDYLQEVAKDNHAFLTHGIVVLRVNNKAPDYVLNFLAGRLPKLERWEDRERFLREAKIATDEVECLEYLRSVGFTRSVENMYRTMEKLQTAKKVLKETGKTTTWQREREVDFYMKNPDVKLPNVPDSCESVLDNAGVSIEKRMNRILERAEKGGWADKTIRRKMKEMLKKTEKRVQRKARNTVVYGVEYKNF